MASSQLLLSFSKRYPGLIALTVLLGFSGALFNGVSTALIVPVLLSFLGIQVDFMGTPPVLQSILSPFERVPEDYKLVAMTLAIVGLIIFKNLATYFNTLMSSSLKRTLANDLRKEGVRLLLDVDMDFFAKNGIGDLSNRIGSEVGRASTAFATVFRSFTTVITILVFIAILLSLSWQLTIASTLLLGVVSLANQYSISRAKHFGKLLSESSKGYSTTLLDVMTGIRLVHATGNEEREYQRIVDLILQREQAEFQSQANSAAINPVSEVTGIVALICIVLVGRTFLVNQIEAFSTVLLTYMFVLFRTLPLIAQLNGSRNQFANASPSVEIVHHFLRRDNKSFMENGTLSHRELNQGIHFKNLSFTYPDHASLVLDNVDLVLPKGQTLALVGASGAGKSTLADLLPRFYDPTSGCILLDGVDLREFDVKTVRRAMGIVSQDTFLFNTSIRKNIAYARPDALDEDIIKAAQLANAYEFIERLPQGLDTVIGDRGIMLSGGQRQRLAIARALLQNPEILILDEATSALDTVSERLVQEAIDNLSRDRTTLVIAHRLSTVQKAHQIAVMEKGRVVEVGTHDELLMKGGYYTRLYSMQFAENGNGAISPILNDKLTQLSYEIRTRLNSSLGSLRLIVDGMVDTPDEQIQLTEEAYISTARLLATLEVIENNGKH